VNVLYIGLGRIGLPQALLAASSGHNVVGVETNSKVVNELSQYKTHFFEKGMSDILKEVLNKSFFVYENVESVEFDADVVFFVLGTEIPSYPEKMDFSSTLEILKIMAIKFPNAVFVFRTTLPVGTVDYFRQEVPNINLAFVPERLAEGNAISEEKYLPKIIGAYNDKTFEILQEYFSVIGGDIIKVRNPKAAEFCKLVDNSYRNTIFAFSNDIALTAENNGVDIYEVIDSVNHGYERNNIAYPGFVSGYCLGKDPYIFEYAYDHTNREGYSMWYAGRETNDYLYEYIANKAVFNKPSKVGILGISFKSNVDDFRMSHTLRVIDEIKNIDSNIHFNLYDSFQNTCFYTRFSDFLSDDYSVKENIEDVISSSEVVIIATNHDEIKMFNRNKLREILEKQNTRIIDIWNVWGDLYQTTKLYNSFGRG